MQASSLQQLGLLKNANYSYRFLITPLLFICVLIDGCDSWPQYSLVDINGKTMGTTYQLKFGKVHQDVNQLQLENEIEHQLTEITRQMSTWEVDSEISQFNRSFSTDWFTVSPEFAYVVSKSLEYHHKTAGKFDITVKPLIDIWKVGNNHPLKATSPTDQQIQNASQYVGSQYLEVRINPPALRKQFPQVQIEVSAIAQGYGIDQLCNILQSHKIQNYLVEIGGEIQVSGSKVDGQPWHVAIERPYADKLEIESILVLNHGAVATSGTYLQRRVDQSGKTFSHILNPLTGKPVTHSTVSVSVYVDTTSLDADAISTALMVMGKESGLAWAEEQGIAAIFFHFNATGELEITTSSRLKSLLQINR
jgi:FAD:protein FMN transferase